jgi:predicted RNA methylase
MKSIVRTAALAAREVRNLAAVLRNRGARAGMQTLAEDVRFVLAWRKSGARNNRFDAEQGSETGGTVPLFRLSIDSPNVRYGRHYTATPAESIHSALAAIRDDRSDFTFIDLGCGKGRVLLVAAQYGFKEIIGVEFARELADTARSNCQQLQNVRVSVEDAAVFRVPDGKLVVYMFNPFERPVMRAVIANLLSHSDTVYVIYYNPVHADLFDNDNRFLRQEGCPNTRIWKIVPRLCGSS